MRRLHLAVPVLAAVLTHAGPAAAAAVPGVELLDCTSAGARLEVRAPWPVVDEPEPGADVSLRVEGWNLDGSTPGAPELPVGGTLLALPPGTVPSLSVRVLEERTLPVRWLRPIGRPTIREDGGALPSQETIRIRDAALYAAPYPPAWASLGQPGGLRHLRVVPIELHPYRWDPNRSGVVVATRLEVIVTFVPEQGAEARQEAAPLETDGRWDDLYAGLVLNHAAARAWRRSPVAPRGFSRALGARTGPEYRVSVDVSGITRVTFEELAALGFPAGLPVDQIAVNERFYVDADPVDPFVELGVPAVVRDLDEDAAFGEGDDVFFLGRNAWDRLHPAERDRRYGRRNAYYISARAEGGLRMAVAPSFLDREDLQTETTGWWSARFEEDAVYSGTALNAAGVGGGETPPHPELGVMEIVRDHFFWVGLAPGTFTREIQLPGFVSSRGARFALQGALSASGGAVNIYAGTGEASIPRRFAVAKRQGVVFEVDASDLDSLVLAPGANSLRYEIPDGQHAVCLNWVDWTWNRTLTAQGDRVAWKVNPPAGGAREFQVSGFSAGDGGGVNAILVFDVTDSLAPRFLTYERSQLSNAGRALKIQIDQGAPSSTPAYVALRAEAAESPAGIALESGDDLTRTGDEEITVVLPDLFRAALEPWVEHRESQGFGVRVATLQDIYDQFGGGRPWPSAIRSWLRYLFRTRDVDPSFLLLFGDASEDFANVLDGRIVPEQRSAPNRVPTQMVFSSAFSDAGSELVASDEWFVDNLTGVGENLDLFPDMHVGRLPATTVEDAGLLVAKVLAYEEFRDSDAWRNRGLFVSDDEYSNRIGFSGSYRWWGDANRNAAKDGESRFLYAARRSARIIREAGFLDFASDSFPLAAYMDTIPCLGRCIPDSNGSDFCGDWRCPTVGGDVPTSARTGTSICYAAVDCAAGCGSECDNMHFAELGLTRSLLDRMGQGHLFVSYQGHANRQLMSHEYILQHFPLAGRYDCDLVENVGKPFVFMGFGCHLAEFASAVEGIAGRGDCIAERFMLQSDGRGSIASIASTGYEWLDRTDMLNTALVHAWFRDPPHAAGYTRWRLGEIFTAGKVRMRAVGPDSWVKGMVPTYTLLGDPSLEMDLAPPRLAMVTVNGDPWTEGAGILAASGGDSARIEILLTDEVQIASAAVTGEDGPVDPSQYELVADPTDPDNDRRRILRYDAHLSPPKVADSEIVLAATDRAGRTREARLPVRMEAAFAVRERGVYEEIAEGDYLAGTDSIRVELAAPIEVAPSELALRVDGDALPDVRMDPISPRGDGYAYRWVLRGRLPTILEGEGHHLTVSVRRRGDGQLAERSRGFLVEASRTQLLDLYNFPNPFVESTGFYFSLNGNARRARLSIYTLRGKRIWSEEAPAARGQNIVSWDGRDEDGDQVANGLYFYRLEVDTWDGRSLTRSERLARVR